MLFLFFIALLIVLNPYTILGPLGYFLLPLLSLPLLDKFRLLKVDTFFLLIVMVFISLVGVLSSFVHDIEQFVHLKVSLSVVGYVLFGYVFFLISRRWGFNFNHLAFVILMVVVVNSSVILVQVIFDPFRVFIEGFLVPSGNVDWSEGFRYRGLASGGGASLSVLIPVAIALALHLYSEKEMNIVLLLLFVSALVVSLFFIGRTGFLLLPLVFFLFFLFNSQKYLLRVFVFLIVAVIFVFLFGEAVKGFVIEQYGVGFYNYSFGFILDGVDGFKEEGTVSIIFDFLHAIPSTFPEVLIGYGFYGGSDFDPWTDSGYSRMFLSVGYLFGLSFYCVFFLIFRKVIFHKGFLFLTIGAVLLIAEIKEPLLFTGYASRVYILLLAYCMFEYNFLKGSRYVTAQGFACNSLKGMP